MVKILEKHVSGKSDVLQFKPRKNSKGRYIPYCDYGWKQLKTNDSINNNGTYLWKI